MTPAPGQGGRKQGCDGSIIALQTGPLSGCISEPLLLVSNPLKGHRRRDESAHMMLYCVTVTHGLYGNRLG